MTVGRCSVEEEYACVVRVDRLVNDVDSHGYFLLAVGCWLLLCVKRDGCDACRLMVLRESRRTCLSCRD
jgi:hypothetical protein